MLRVFFGGWAVARERAAPIVRLFQLCRPEDHLRQGDIIIAATCAPKNVVGYSCDPTYTQREPVHAFVLPFSFGVQGEFQG